MSQISQNLVCFSRTSIFVKIYYLLQHLKKTGTLEALGCKI
jgi:hypothetical protein